MGDALGNDASLDLQIAQRIGALPKPVKAMPRFRHLTKAAGLASSGSTALFVRMAKTADLCYRDHPAASGLPALLAFLHCFVICPNRSAEDVGGVTQVIDTACRGDGLRLALVHANATLSPRKQECRSAQHRAGGG